MPISREYDTFELREMLQSAEGVPSPVTGKAAHSRGLHASATPGGQGVTSADMIHRTHKEDDETYREYRARDGSRCTSAFANLVQQADAAGQALNSAKGREALGHLDAVQYADQPLRLVLDVYGLRQIGCLDVGPGQMKMAHKSQSTVTTTSADGVRLIIDRAPRGSEIHIQTCFPLTGAGQSSYKLAAMASGSNGTRQPLVSG